ncbi:MAG TPA: hypothetical protein VFJ16_02385 [Longimicrobium sp.]|nr:hypothetical protein [Longimicrobium sp.]
MKKLSLALDAIDVESFPTAEQQLETGTVQGYITLNCTGSHDTCDPRNTMLCDTKVNCMPPCSA